MNTGITVYTIGHSTRSGRDVINLLKKEGIKAVVDVRSVPRSAFNPQFNNDVFPVELSKEGIEYIYMKGLGGLRKPEKDSVNTGWNNASFRGFADYMQTPEFEQNIGEILKIAAQKKVAIMCAEAVPWRCHRLLISDALTVRGVKVEHIMGVKGLHIHELTPFLRAEGTKITYPGGGMAGPGGEIVGPGEEMAGKTVKGKKG